MLVAALALLSAAAACGDDTAQAADTAVAVRASAPQPPLSPASAPRGLAAHAADTGLVLALDGDGLRLFLSPSGSARPIPFGAPRADVIAQVSRAQGAVAAQGVNQDCAAQFVEWPGGLTVWFTRERFAGWSLRAGSRLSTASGIGLGSTRADLRAAYASVRIQHSTLGEEFAVDGGIAGLLSSARPDARVEYLWAGIACVAR